MPATERPLRADAARNRAKILDAAREQITEHGPEVPMDTIAEAAGVAVGTLYRHFPDKTALVEAVLSEHLDELAAHAERAGARVGTGADPLTELYALITVVVETAARDAALRAAARRFGAQFEKQNGKIRTMSALHEIIDAAHATGALHPDVTIDDFILLLVTAPLDAPPESRRRWLELILPGLSAARPINRGRPLH